ncbi:helix-turn-helix domain-containing protein [Microbacterium sp.]|uniref:AraC-like ligand-binding domain-containing protein n=1 Tax=Microbacterium sp. TaxID=51671 RepID=UPI0039E4B03A
MSNISAISTVSTIRVDDIDHFRTAVSESFVPLRIDSDRPSLHGVIRGACADGIHLTEVGATAHTVTRTPELIARSPRGAYKVSLLLAGSGLLIQDGREAVLREGDFAIYDTSRPYTLGFDRDFRTLVLMFPYEVTTLSHEAMHELTATRLAGDTGLGAIVAPFLARLGARMDELTGAAGVRLAHTAVDLVTTALVHELGFEGAAADPRRTLLHRIHGYIDEHLDTADLTPGAIAAAHYISVRHLHSLFHESGTTVSAVVRSRRLERCRRDLLEPMLAERPVAAIGARWGFADAAHFSRAFKSAYGVSPNAYRHAA